MGYVNEPGIMTTHGRCKKKMASIPVAILRSKLKEATGDLSTDYPQYRTASPTREVKCSER